MFKSISILLLAGLLSCGTKSDKANIINDENVETTAQRETPKTVDVRKESKSKSWTEFKNSELSIDYPADWKIDDSGKSKTTFIVFPDRNSGEGGFTDNINLVIQKATAGLTLDKVSEMITKGNEKREGYKLLKSSKKKLKGSEILNLEYTGTRQDYDLKYKQHFIIKNGKVYNLTFTAKQKTYNKRVFKVIRMFNSLDIN